MSNFTVSVKLNPKLEPTLTQVSDKMIYAIAKETLTQSESVIPLRTGKMRKSSITAGVKGSNRDYYIGSYTSYATHVWNLPDNTNWTTPGTNNRWFERTLREKGQMIIINAVGRNKL